jgi:SPP1 family predicted phage head-tail adaptor
MQAGKLKRRIILQSFTETPDGYGQAVKTWAALSTVWAEIVALSGKELANAQQISAEVNYRIRIRYLSTVKAEHRVLFGSRIYNVTAPIPDVNNTYLDLFCVEVIQ